VSTALILHAATVSSVGPGGACTRPRADFLAQLIATAAQAPQTRPRRRVAPAEAAAVYGTVEQSPRVLRPTLLRSL
jgi:hypothetical protein